MQLKGFLSFIYVQYQLELLSVLYHV